MTLIEEEELTAQNALSLWGKDAQMIVCIEELAELAHALAKEMRASRRSDPICHAVDVSHIAAELADVEIITNQIKIIFDREQSGTFSAQIRDIKEAKLTRLRDRIHTAQVRRDQHTHSRKTYPVYAGAPCYLSPCSWLGDRHSALFCHNGQCKGIIEGECPFDMKGNVLPKFQGFFASTHRIPRQSYDWEGGC